jgi:hypothetical protein
MNGLNIDEVRFILFTQRDLEAYSRALDAIAKESQ